MEGKNELKLSCIYKMLISQSEVLSEKANGEVEYNEKSRLTNKIWRNDNRATWIAHCIALYGDISIKEAIVILQSTTFSLHQSCCGENPWSRCLEYLQSDELVI
ncbi:TPA: hypothetical protein P2B70_004910 [Salmonella enterica subsp. enterica serovar Eastbourne]|nr:hypothetical protein [Salmonella enterica subsp. enterica serovar Eastbourne]HDN7577103.1 hypothetical protein [Salmonella enterica subsp. enterica serovar Eastbourne]